MTDRDPCPDHLEAMWKSRSKGSRRTIQAIAALGLLTMLLLLVPMIGGATAGSLTVAMGTAPTRHVRPPANSSPPTISGTPQSGQTLTATTGTWSGSPASYAYQWQRCNSIGASCLAISGATTQTYVLTSADVGFTIRVTVTATNSAGSASATSAPTAVVTAASPPPGYFGMEPSARCTGVGYSSCAASTGLPRSDAYCASAVTVSGTWEPRPDNFTANHTVETAPYGWNPDPYWTGWMSNLAKVDGNFTGTTSQIIQWAGCKWGIDEDTIRAVAVQESHWHQNDLGDLCGGNGSNGIASYGILQIKNEDCSGSLVHGGWHDTQLTTALVADWYGARIRSCYDGVFYGWQYAGGTVEQWAASHGWDDVKWGCVGFHFNSKWDPNQTYVQQVKQHLADRTWEQPGF
jgi:hypothetical protein